MRRPYYSTSDGGAKDAARLRFALFDEQSVREMISLVNDRGLGLIDDIYRNPADGDPPHVLGIMGREYMRHSDVPDVILGLSTVILAQLRKPKMGPDEYTKILEEAFGLPTLLARKLADNIESYDKITADANRDGDTAWGERLQSYILTLEEGARRVVNNLANSFGLSTVLNWDQSQTYDYDYLAELASLGETVAKLNQRSRLISGQVLIASQMQMFQTGDIDEEDGDPIGELVGDVLFAAGARNLPDSVTGPFKDIMLQTRKATLDMGKSLFNKAGVYADADKKIKSKATDATGNKIKKVIGQVLAKLPGAGILTAAMKLTKPQRNVARASSHKDKALGDIARSYGDVMQGFGESVADAWLAGDISAISRALAIADGQDVGDVDSVYDETVGDEAPLVGGLFKKKKKKKKLPEAAIRANKVKAMREEAARLIRRRNENIAEQNRLRNEMQQEQYLQMLRDEASDPFAGMDMGYDPMMSSAVPGNPMYDAALLAQNPMMDSGLLFDQLNPGVSLNY